MRAFVIAILAAASPSGPASGSVIPGFYSSFYVLGDSLSDDGNVPGLAWLLATGGSPYRGNWRDGGTFTNGDVWNEPLQDDFRNAGRDADNFAMGSAQSSGGNLLIPDLDDQIDELFDETSSNQRGKNPLVSIWIGGNNILDGIGGHAVEEAVAAARTVARGIRRLATNGVDEFLVLNLPDLGMIPQFRLFRPQHRDEARAAGKAYNAELARRVRSLERDGLNIVDIDVFSLFADVIANKEDYGFSGIKLPCVFPDEDEADKYDQPERCSSSTAKKRLFMDALHPNDLAHRIIGDLVEDALEAEVQARTSRSAASATPQPVPLPGSLALLAGALGAAMAFRQRARAWA